MKLDFKVISLLTFLLMGGVALAEKVCSVHDGDTFTLCQGAKVRLWGIDAPELSQVAGYASRQALNTFINDKEVRLQCRGKSYKRKVCRVTTSSGTDAGSVMVKSGWAFDYPQYSHGAYQSEEQFAKAKHAGVWKEQNGGMRPWVYRRHG